MGPMGRCNRSCTGRCGGAVTGSFHGCVATYEYPESQTVTTPKTFDKKVLVNDDREHLPHQRPYSTYIKQQ